MNSVQQQIVGMDTKHDTVFTIEIVADVPLLEPVDVIDLTEDSPRSQNMRNQTGCRARTPSQSGNTRTCQWERQQASDPSTRQRSATGRSRTRTANKENNATNTDEIISLDDTVDDSGNGLYINDSINGGPILLSCPICFEQLSSSLKPTSTRCGHIFCQKCLQMALQNKKRCPKCTRPVNLKTCTQLYF